MNRLEDSHNIRSFFRQNKGNDPEQIRMVVLLRDKAIEILKPVIKNVPRNFSRDSIDKYEDKGISTQWNLESTDVYEFRFAASSANLTSSEKKAAELLAYCTEAIEAGNLSDNLQQWILDAYASLDDDEISKSREFSKSQSEKARKSRGKVTEDGETISQIIERIANIPEYNEYSARELWHVLLGELDQLLVDYKESYDSNSIEYFRDVGNTQSRNETPRTLAFKTFQNRLSTIKSR